MTQWIAYTFTSQAAPAIAPRGHVIGPEDRGVVDDHAAEIQTLDRTEHPIDAIDFVRIDHRANIHALIRRITDDHRFARLYEW